jgi:hypothetical protein
MTRRRARSARAGRTPPTAQGRWLVVSSARALTLHRAQKLEYPETANGSGYPVWNTSSFCTQTWTRGTLLTTVRLTMGPLPAPGWKQHRGAQEIRCHAQINLASSSLNAVTHTLHRRKARPLPRGKAQVPEHRSTRNGRAPSQVSPRRKGIPSGCRLVGQTISAAWDVADLLGSMEDPGWPQIPIRLPR